MGLIRYPSREGTIRLYFTSTHAVVCERKANRRVEVRTITASFVSSTETTRSSVDQGSEKNPPVNEENASARSLVTTTATCPCPCTCVTVSLAPRDSFVQCPRPS